MRKFTEAEKLFLRQMLDDTLNKTMHEGDSISRVGDFAGTPFTITIKRG